MADDLRHRYAEAIGPAMRIGLQDADLWGPGGTERINEWIEWLADKLAAVRDEELERLRELIRELHDPDPCRFDHHGNCQAHDLGNPCAHARAQEILAALPDRSADG